MKFQRYIVLAVCLVAVSFCSSRAAAQGYRFSGFSGASSSFSDTVPAQLCQTRSNDTPARLLECIQQASLWKHLSHFQVIADDNPGPDGHGNRDTGTSGYKASVAYVEGLMKAAGYKVTVQAYPLSVSEVVGTPEFSTDRPAYPDGTWFVARLSASGAVDAAIEPVSGGCAADDFRNFAPGRIALIERGGCSYTTKVDNAEQAGAAAVILYNRAGENTPANAMNTNHAAPSEGGAYPARLVHAATIPVIGVAAHAIGEELSALYVAGKAPVAHIDIRTQEKLVTDYNLIADSPNGDPSHVVVVEGHLDSIYGAGMLDNASGSTTILEIALNMAKTSTLNQLRYVWFGGEELGLHGSAWYTRHLSQTERAAIVFDIDADVTATPNYDYQIANPADASNVNRFPKNVVPESQIGTRAFQTYFQSIATPVQSAPFGNDGTDSNSFSLIGIPNTGILTEQDCCKAQWEVNVWGGYLGDYEGKVPGFNGGCVDRPQRWCDNLSNNDPGVFEVASKATAYVVQTLANHAFGAGASSP